MSGWVHFVESISCRCFNLFLHTSDNVYEAVSSLLLGARASAAFYAATVTCFFLKDCHEKTTVEAMAPLTPQCWFGEALVRNLLRGLSLYALFIAQVLLLMEPVCVRVIRVTSQTCRKSRKTVKRHRYTCTHSRGYIVACDYCRIDVGRTGLCHVPIFLRRQRVVRFAALVGNLWY